VIIRILEEVADDLIDGRSFYGEIEVGLGDYFTDLIIADIWSLRFSAEIHSKKWGPRM